MSFLFAVTACPISPYNVRLESRDAQNQEIFEDNIVVENTVESIYRGIFSTSQQ